MARGLILAVAIFAGIGASVALGRFGVQNVFLKAAAFSVAFVLIFGGYSWSRKSGSAPPAIQRESKPMANRDSLVE